VSTIIRPAEPAEDDRIADLVVNAYVDGGHIRPGDGYVQVLRATAQRRAHAEVLVATVAEAADAAEIAGTVTVVRGGTEFSEFGDPGDLEIRMLAVDPAFAGRGVGRRLLEIVLDRAREQRASGVSLFTLDSMTAARSLYLRAGFEATPERDHVPVPGVQLRAFRLSLSRADRGAGPASDPRPPR
jgi:ribosomal protein S18 acetylase RimI-like enzyme